MFAVAGYYAVVCKAFIFSVREEGNQYFTPKLSIFEKENVRYEQ